MDKVDMDKTMAFGGNSGRWQKVCNAHENCKENLTPQKPFPFVSAFCGRASASSAGELWKRDLSREPGTEAAAAAGGQDQLTNGNQTQALTLSSYIQTCSKEGFKIKQKLQKKINLPLTEKLGALIRQSI